MNDGKERFPTDKIKVSWSRDKKLCRIDFINESKTRTIEMPAAGVSYLLAELSKAEEELQEGRSVKMKSAAIITDYAISPAADGSFNVGIQLYSGPSSWTFTIESEEARTLAERIRGSADMTPLRIG